MMGQQCNASYSLKRNGRNGDGALGGPSGGGCRGPHDTPSDANEGPQVEVIK